MDSLFVAVVLLVGQSLFFPIIHSRGFVTGFVPEVQQHSIFPPYSSKSLLLRSSSSSSSSSSLYAKKKKKSTTGASGRKRGDNNNGGGFGVASTATKNRSAINVDADDDYAIFPALERSVMETLVPTDGGSDGEASGGPLSDEIYQRLDQIYGFANFNGQRGISDDEDDDGHEPSVAASPLSFQEMLSSSLSRSETMSSDYGSLDRMLDTSSSSSTTTTTTKATMGDPDLDSLLVSATGGGVSLTVASKTTTKKKNKPEEKEEASRVTPRSTTDLKQCLGNLAPFDKFRVLHTDPLVLAIDEFFTPEECQRYLDMSMSKRSPGGKNRQVMSSRSPTVGKDAAAVAQRTSTTYYHYYENVPELMSKASKLLGLTGIDHWEEPQTVRYRRNEKFTWHLDALGPMEKGLGVSGQRIATLLVYLTEMAPTDGGATVFRDLGGGERGGSDSSDSGGDYSSRRHQQHLRVRPMVGSALLFFPAAGGIPETPVDIRTLHAGEVVSDRASTDKWIAQLWLRERPYKPTAPAGNRHEAAVQAMSEYCRASSS